MYANKEVLANLSQPLHRREAMRFTRTYQELYGDDYGLQISSSLFTGTEIEFVLPIRTPNHRNSDGMWVK